MLEFPDLVTDVLRGLLARIPDAAAHRAADDPAADQTGGSAGGAG
jgi:hypothetical protein